MRHQRDERHLPHIGALARHVRAGDDEHAVILVVEQRAVWHKLIVAVHTGLDDGMTAIDDINHAVIGNFRADIAVFDRRNRQRDQRIQRFQADRRMLNPGNLSGQEFADFDKQPLFQTDCFFLRAEHGLLNFMQLRRHVALAVGQRLFSRVAIRHLLVVGFRHLDIVAENAVVLNFQILDARQLAFLRFQIGDPLMAVSGGLPQLVQFLVIAAFDVMPLAHQRGRVHVDGLRQLVHHVAKRRQMVEQTAEHAVRRDGGQRVVNRRNMRKRIAQGKAVLRVDGFVCDSAEQAFHVVNLRQLLADHVHRHIRVAQRLHRLQTLVNFALDGQRLLDEAAKRSRAHRRAGVIQNAQK